MKTEDLCLGFLGAGPQRSTALRELVSNARPRPRPRIRDSEAEQAQNLAFSKLPGDSDTDPG